VGERVRRRKPKKRRTMCTERGRKLAAIRRMGRGSLPNRYRNPWREAMQLWMRVLTSNPRRKAMTILRRKLKRIRQLMLSIRTTSTGLSGA
jgi:hypothetical protein